MATAELTPAIAAAADAARLADLSAQSTAQDAVFVELLYRDRWVRFDLSVMTIQHGDVAAAFRAALTDLGVPEAVTA